MSKKTLPVPPANRSDKGPGGDKAAPVTGQMEERQARKSEQDAHNANIKQNTTHQGYQQDR
ncbi:hypothetical protein [Bosea vaviloviae]|uniref:Uncharacterized protein n=1 Tax=Bosea vaviloviae TaxID=1526658 RepID=A0A1D7U478_9HYPH|nr:hypothetical protein [Bosea vaviloviae]AOO82177.1 hypothetical protein BHK69_18555 [Bosea vaviloviae]